ncbi:MAG: hypothetical protein Q7S40_07845 [Opitutaceae bacterium]|nr:hypothetical protein [Opitutaceae bacterium]
MQNQTVMDVAFQLAKKAHDSASHAAAKDQLQSKFPSEPWDEIVNAYVKGCELVEKCYEIADSARRLKISDAEAIEMLRQRFPGFSGNIYNEALTHGWFLSR